MARPKKKKDEIPKPIMRLRTRKLYYDSVIQSDSPEADAMFELMGRKTMSHKELPFVVKMGFTVDVRGETSSLSNEMTRDRIDHNKVMGNRPLVFSLIDEYEEEEDV